MSEHQDGEQKSRVETCPTCKTTTISFDPPLYFEPSEACGAEKPGNYTSQHPGGIPHCHGPVGHDGEHYYLVEYVDRWPS